MIPMTTSDRAFEQAANAFAATTQAQYVRYEEKIPIDSKTLRINQAFSESVVRRNSDDTSVVTFESGRFYRARRHLITPSFNVMSDFGLRGTFSSSGQFSMWVENVVPLKYNLTPRPGVGVVSVALQKYRTQFVDDVGPDQLHIHLDSANGETSILPRLFLKTSISTPNSDFRSEPNLSARTSVTLTFVMRSRAENSSFVRFFSTKRSARGWD